MLKSPANEPAHYRRILAVKLADLGDLLTITPALQALRAAHPTATIDLLTPPSSADLLKGSGLVDDIITVDKFPFDSPRGILNLKLVVDTVLFLVRLRLARYDALAIFHHYTTRWGTAKFALVAYASGAAERAGLDNGRGRFLTLHALDRGFGTIHEADYWLTVASLLGAQRSGGWRTQMPVSEEDRHAAVQLLAPLLNTSRGPLVVVHAGTGWYGPARLWPVENFAVVARGLIRSLNARIVIIGGPGEKDMAEHLQTLIDQPGHVLNLAEKTTVHQTGAVIERCDLFLGNDSGPMHIAAAVGTPVVAVFGPSNRRAWGPYTPPGEESIHTIVSRHDLPCIPCFYRGHSLGLRDGCGPRPCLTRLSPAIVLAACRQKLDASGRWSVARERSESERRRANGPKATNNGR